MTRILRKQNMSRQRVWKHRELIDRSPEKQIEPSKIDRWLARLSHVAQFGLFVITVGSLYFTVLPLYQKAVLEESIARKELELKEISYALERAYVKIRDASIREFHFISVFECTMLWKQAPLPESMGGPPAAARTDFELALEFDTRNCLINVAKLHQVARDLKVEDRDSLNKLIDEAALRIESKRFEGLRRFKEVPEKITLDVAKSKKLEGIRAHWLAELEQLLGIDAVAPERLKLAITLEQEAIALAFEDVVKDEIRTIKFSE